MTDKTLDRQDKKSDFKKTVNWTARRKIPKGGHGRGANDQVFEGFMRVIGWNESGMW